MIMHLLDDDGQELDANYSVETDGTHLDVIMESRSGTPPRNPAYNRTLTVLLTRLGTLDTVLADAWVDSRWTQRMGIPAAERRLIEMPTKLPREEADANDQRIRMADAQARVSMNPDGSKAGGTKRIRLRVEVPGYQPGDAARLAETLAAPITETPEKVLTHSRAEQAEEAAGDADGAPTQLDWTREEIILAMDLYVTSGAFSRGPVPGQRSDNIIQLSRLLQELSAYPRELQGEEYRSPDGVHLKLMDLRAIQTESAHGVNTYSQSDAAVWREYADDLPRLHQEAEAIRAWLREGVIQPATTEPAMEDVDIEQQHTETYMVCPSGEPRAAERAEQGLVRRYRDYMAVQGIEVRRKKYLPAGEVWPIYSDAWVEDRHALIEAKNSDSRDAIRQAIGQLSDYRRFHQPPVRLAVLLPYPPKAERLDLLRSVGVEAVWPHGPGFRDSANGAFV